MMMFQINFACIEDNAAYKFEGKSWVSPLYFVWRAHMAFPLARGAVSLRSHEVMGPFELKSASAQMHFSFQ